MLPLTNYQLVKAKTVSPVELNSTNVQEVRAHESEILNFIKLLQVTE